MSDPYGIELERRRREITAHHGVPDFVFFPVDVPKGGGQREVGDFLLWVGNLIAIVSHKSRDPAAAARETQGRRRKWLDRNISKAYGQIKGVAKTLRMAAAGEIVLTSERGVRVPWDPARIDDYVGVVIIDGPEPDDDYAPPVMREGVPAVAMLAPDWDRLNQLLPSTASMIRYVVRRQHAIPSCPLGSELDVFALLIEQDTTDQPLEIPPPGLPKDTFERALANHPDRFLGTHREDRFAFIVNTMIEGAADADPEFSDASDPLAYLRIVEFLDRIPLLTRVKIGKSIVDRCERVGREGGEISARIAVPHGLLVLLVDGRDRAERAKRLRGLTSARHSQALDAGAPTSIVTLGVATEPIPSPDGRSHDFVLIEGNIRSDPEFRTQRDELFGVADMAPFMEQWRWHGRRP